RFGFGGKFRNAKLKSDGFFVFSHCIILLYEFISFHPVFPIIRISFIILTNKLPDCVFLTRNIKIHKLISLKCTTKPHNFCKHVQTKKPVIITHIAAPSGKIGVSRAFLYFHSDILKKQKRLE
ncbi:MAG: hypothetical protein IJA70_01410, partial [Oscillospiraceae bacterium]|nr:hypothetical protein [Oscillospiraceae bacterium]